MTSTLRAAKFLNAGIVPAVRLLSCMALALVLAACSPQATEQELLERARDAMDQRNARAAIIDIKTLLQQNPDHGAARRLLGEIHLFQQNPAAAVEAFERALATSDDADMRVLYARALLSAGRGEQLLELNQQGDFASVEDNPDYLAALARAQAASGDLPAARDALDAALAAAPDAPYVATTHAFFQVAHSGDLETAEATLQAVLSAHPEYVDAWALLAGLQQMRGALAQAETSFARAVELNPYRLADRLNLVKVRLDQGKAAAAEAELDRLLASNPDHPGVNFLKGRMLVASGDNEGALAAFFKVLNVLPSHPGSLYLAAIANIREGQLATALGQLEALLAAQPDHVNGRLVLANLHLLRAEPKAAEPVARDLLQDDDGNYAAMAMLAAALDAQDGRVSEEQVELYQRMAAIRPEAAEPRLALGTALLQDGDVATGIAQFEAARALAPDSNRVRERLIQAHLAGGDIAAAREEAEAYAEQQPQDPRPALFLGRIALQEEDAAVARQHFEQALELDPGNVTANNGLAVLASADQDLEQARARYMDALAHHPDDVATLLNLASVEGVRGDTEAMEGNLEAALRADGVALAPRLSLARLKLQQGKRDEAVNLLTEVRDDHPRAPGLWLLLAEAQLSVGELEAAAEAGERLLELLPDDAIALATVARVAFRGGRFDVAERHLRQAIDLQPDNVAFRKLLSDTLMGQGELQEADAILADLPADDASAPEVLVARGRIALADDRPADAEPYLRRALDKAPANRTLLWLSGAMSAQGRSSEAIELLEDWLTEQPDDVLVRNRLASSYLQQGDERQARQQYQQVLEQSPDNVLVLNNLAWLLRKHDPRQALAHIDKAHSLAPDNAQVVDTYAMIQLERGDRREALSLSRRALDLMPNNSMMRYHRALILHADGQREAAIRLLEGLAGNADATQREQAQARLAEWQGT